MLLKTLYNKKAAESVEKILNSFVKSVYEAGGKTRLTTCGGDSEPIILTKNIKLNFYIPIESEESNG